MSDQNDLTALVGRYRAVQASQPPRKHEDAISKDLIKAIAMEIGKGTVAYVEVMYPEAIKATSSTFKLSLRNHVYNDIMAIAELNTEKTIQESLSARSIFRKRWVAMYRKMRRRK